MCQGALCRGCREVGVTPAEGLRVELRAVAPHRIEYPGQLPRQRDASPRPPTSGGDPHRPVVEGLVLLVAPPQQRPRRLHQQRPRSAAARLADVPPMLALARTVLAWDQTEV